MITLYDVEIKNEYFIFSLFRLLMRVSNKSAVSYTNYALLLSTHESFCDVNH